MGRWLVVRVAAWGLRGGISDDHAEQVLRERFPWRGAAWRWEVIGDAKLRNDRRAIRRGYREWRKTGA